jgi:hypothetical protein
MMSGVYVLLVYLPQGLVPEIRLAVSVFAGGLAYALALFLLDRSVVADVRDLGSMLRPGRRTPSAESS